MMEKINTDHKLFKMPQSFKAKLIPLWASIDDDDDDDDDDLALRVHSDPK